MATGGLLWEPEPRTFQLARTRKPEVVRASFKELSDEILNENERLSTKVAELSLEVEAWRAGNLAIKRENDALKEGLAVYKSNTTNIVLLLVDGDGAVWTDGLLKQGREGGRQAVMMLMSFVTKEVQLKGVDNPVIVCSIFMNKHGMAGVLDRHGASTPSNLDDFITGFNEASPLWNIIDVGGGKEAADSKIRETLKLYASFPQTKLIFLAASHDSGYTPILRDLASLGLTSKLVLLKSYSDMVYDIQTLGLPTVESDGIFRKQKLPYAAPKVFPGPPPGFNPDLAPRVFNPAAAASKPPIYVHNYRTRPCVHFHLGNSCTWGDKCTFSHDPISEEAKQLLSKQMGPMADKYKHAKLSKWSKPTFDRPNSEPSRLRPELAHFQPLLDAIVQADAAGTALRSVVGSTPAVNRAWREHGLDSFKAYCILAEAEGLVTLERPACPGTESIYIKNTGVVLGSRPAGLKAPASRGSSDEQSSPRSSSPSASVASEHPPTPFHRF